MCTPCRTRDFSHGRCAAWELRHWTQPISGPYHPSTVHLASKPTSEHSRLSISGSISGKYCEAGLLYIDFTAAGPCYNIDFIKRDSLSGTVSLEVRPSRLSRVDCKLFVRLCSDGKVWLADPTAAVAEESPMRAPAGRPTRDLGPRSPPATARDLDRTVNLRSTVLELPRSTRTMIPLCGSAANEKCSVYAKASI